MSEKQFTFGAVSPNVAMIKYNGEPMDIGEVVDKLNEQQSTINKLRKILAEAEDTIEIRLAEHYLKEYENIKHNIIGDNDE